jgi:hypothetical protein
MSPPLLLACAVSTDGKVDQPFPSRMAGNEVSDIVGLSPVHGPLDALGRQSQMMCTQGKQGRQGKAAKVLAAGPKSGEEQA